MSWGCLAAPPPPPPAALVSWSPGSELMSPPQGHYRLPVGWPHPLSHDSTSALVFPSWGGAGRSREARASSQGGDTRYRSAYSFRHTTDRPESSSFKQHRVLPLRVSAGTWGCSGAGPALQSAGQSLPSIRAQTRLLPRPTYPSVAACPVGTVGLRVSTAMER